MFPTAPIETFFRSQFGKPSGWFGSQFLGPVLNIANIGLIRASVDLLAPKPADVILDIGFGGGYSLMYLAGKAAHGKIVGVDYSQEMVDAATQLVKSRNLASRVSVRWGDVANLQFGPRRFDKVLSVNSIYYWPDVADSLRQIARILKPAGEIAIGLRSPASLRPFTGGWRDFSLYEPQEVARLMKGAGFDVSRVEHRDRWQILDTVVVIGQRRARHT